jgi:aryl-alcohol dehydrogenase-like predicted oxidoreductase
MNTSKLCLGTVQLGMKYGIQGNAKPSTEQAVKLLLKAYAGGISSFDTATAYGEAESILGFFLNHPEVDRSQVEIITKVSLSAHIIARESIRNQIENELSSSLDRLGVANVDGCLFHNAKLLSLQGAYDALLNLKEKNFTKQIGISVYTPEEAMKVLSLEGIDIIQIPYNVLDHRWDIQDFFLMAHEKGIRVFARSVLLQGLLPMSLEMLPEKMWFAKAVLKEFHVICQDYSITPFEAAVGFALNHPGIDRIVFGVDNLEQLDDYLKLSDNNIFALYKTFHSNWLNIDQRIIRPDLW